MARPAGGREVAGGVLGSAGDTPVDVVVAEMAVLGARDGPAAAPANHQVTALDLRSPCSRPAVVGYVVSSLLLRPPCPLAGAPALGTVSGD